jgi:hypothetical protein
MGMSVELARSIAQSDQDAAELRRRVRANLASFADLATRVMGLMGNTTHPYAIAQSLAVEDLTVMLAAGVIAINRELIEAYTGDEEG